MVLSFSCKTFHWSTSQHLNDALIFVEKLPQLRFLAYCCPNSYC